VEELLLPGSVRVRRRVLAGVIAATMLFSLQMDHFGWRYLGGPSKELITQPKFLTALPRHEPGWLLFTERVKGMRAFEHSASSGFK
jgi:hypothetical protein